MPNHQKPTKISNAFGKHWKLSEEAKRNISGGMIELRKTVPPANKKYGLSNTRFWGIWHNMKTRCNNPNVKDYKNYGGRGISVDPSWMKFEGFYEDMFASYQDNLQLDRVDNDRGYSKENCRWVTSKEQQNNKRNNIERNYYATA